MVRCRARFSICSRHGIRMTEMITKIVQPVVTDSPVLLPFDSLHTVLFDLGRSRELMRMQHLTIIPCK